MKKALFLATAITATLAFSSFTQATTIDFDALSQGAALDVHFKEDGYNLHFQNSYIDSSASGRHIEQAIHRSQEGLDISKISKAGPGGAVFTFDSIELATSSFHVGFGPSSVIVEGFFNGASVGVDTFTSIVFGTFETFVASNLSGVNLDHLNVKTFRSATEGYGEFDNINLSDATVSAVPIPAAAFMFVPALLGLMGFRRKLKSA